MNRRSPGRLAGDRLVAALGIPGARLAALVRPWRARRLAACGLGICSHAIAGAAGMQLSGGVKVYLVFL